MNITSTTDEFNKWIELIDQAVLASESNDPTVLDVFNSSGYKITKPIEARSLFIELGYLFLNSNNGRNHNRG